MRPKFNGVKFFSQYDLSVGLELEKAESIIIAMNNGKKLNSINEIIELYNILELMNTGISLPKWSEKNYNDLKCKTKSFMGIIAKYFSQICDDNFIELVQNVAYIYLDDFWKLFCRFNVFEQVTDRKFTEYLELPDTSLSEILVHKKIVKAYDIPLANALRASEQTGTILSTCFLEKSDINYYLPDSFMPNEFEGILQKYIDSEHINPNKLLLIFNAQSTGNCPISDKTRLNAKRRFEEYWKKSEQSAIHMYNGIGIIFADQEELIKYTREGLYYHISYDIKWIKENLDYPTILNNFLYIFEMIDFCWRSTLVSVKSKISAFERAFTPKGVKFYQNGYYFRNNAMISTSQMDIYYDFLKSNDIDLENVFVWFFTEYLKDEFGVDGFFMKASSATNYVEKCRTLASEMDGILKQYRMYVRDGKIDRELFEMSSEHLIIDGMPSQINDKYAYACSNNIQNEMFMMFSDQSVLSYTNKTESKYATLYELLQNETMSIADYKEYQLASLNWLISRHTLILDETGKLNLNADRVRVLKDLYDHDVICIHYLGKWASELNAMHGAGDIRVESTLFSIPEKEYINYELNKAEYSNGLDLRNKYAHSTYPQDENTQKHDYIELLKIMILIIAKINEEFCLLE